MAPRTPTSSTSNDDPAKLKAEGNAFFVKKDYNAALAKYTKAIQLDGNNAVIYANRAACYTGMKKYTEAANDAQKAVDLDPSYVKGWARLATAHSHLDSLDSSAEAWENALSRLSICDATLLSDADKKAKNEYESALAQIISLRSTRRKAAEEKAARDLQKAQAALDRAERARERGVTEEEEREREKEEAKRQRKREQEEARAARQPTVLKVSGTTVSMKGKEMPWNRAMAMYPELASTQNMMSSAWVVKGAYQEFEEGMSLLNQCRRLENGQIYGNLEALAQLTNGVLRDDRIFHVKDPKWQETFELQVTLELSRFVGWAPWTPNETADDIIHAALDRLETKGWDNVRPALAVTVRVHFMHAFLSGNFGRSRAREVELFAKAVEILDMGSRLWRDVPKDERGAIFEPTFVRGVRAFYLTALMQLYTETPKAQRRESMLTRLLDEAEEVYQNACAIPFDTSRASEYDPGFTWSFWEYPKGLALAMKGFYHGEMAKLEVRESIARGVPESYEDIPQSIRNHLTQAGCNYLEAALCFPEDEEQHVWYLNIGLEYLFRNGAPLSVTKGIMSNIRECIPGMKRIWANSAMAMAGRDKELQRTLDFEKEMDEALAKKKRVLVGWRKVEQVVTLKTGAVPGWLRPLSEC